MLYVPISAEHIHGAVSLQREGEWLTPWRLPVDQLRLFPPDDTIGARAQDPAGVRVRFVTDATQIQLIMKPGAQPRLFDLVSDNQLLATARVPAGETKAEFRLDKPSAAPLEIWLTQCAPVSLSAISCADGSFLWPASDNRLRWVAYGSSITQCTRAFSPCRTWPAVAARQHDLHLTCLGYGGQCHLEPMVGLMIRDLPADLITLKVGINVMGHSSLSARTLAPAVIGLVRIIRERHPVTPMAVISPIVSPPREEKPNAVGLNLQLMRTHIKDAVERLVAAGDRYLLYCDGSVAFPAEVAAQYLPDDLHPDGEGNEYLGRRLTELALQPLLSMRAGVQ